ncbi:phosphoglycerate mutase family protein [Teratosphaeria nubilosa]|uniref:Phosphoglycerate mutase family protein n=1 Tax=Teratosphaeria nubilosa TaxID=161662 RepID=A0A6G1L2Z9_9PEZI|nr:phosphoglycerate mutase family protein [Teratosphaeria nubilosa]
MAPTIHCVRHAQGYHNLSVANHSMHDPLLTPLGEQQCRNLAKAFPYHDAVEAVVASPIKRTMYTALLGFGPDIAAKGLKVVALPELQETSDLPCDTGSSPAEVAKEFEGKPVDLALLTEEWCSKRGKYAPHAQAIEARARDARKWLMGRQEKEIIVVSHGGFLHYFTEDWTGSDKFQGTGWANTEFRSYTFSTHDPNNAHLVETTASRKRRLGHEKPLDQNEQEQLKRTATKDWDEKGYVQDNSNGAERARAAQAKLADTRRDDVGGGMASYL